MLLLRNGRIGRTAGVRDHIKARLGAAPALPAVGPSPHCTARAGDSNGQSEVIGLAGSTCWTCSDDKLGKLDKAHAGPLSTLWVSTPRLRGFRTLQAARKLDHLVMVQCSNCDHVEHLGCMGQTNASHRRRAAETAIKAGYPVVPVAGTSASGSAPADGTVPSLLCIECAADAKAEAKLVAREEKKAAKANVSAAAAAKKKKAAAASSSVDIGEDSTRSAGTAGESEEEPECEECERPCDGLEMLQCGNCEGWVHVECTLEEDMPVEDQHAEDWWCRICASRAGRRNLISV